MTTRRTRLGRGLSSFVLVAALGAVAARAEEPAKDPASKDEIALDTVVDPNIPIDIEKILKAWSHKLGILVVVDPQLAQSNLKMRFLQSDVKLTWGIFKQVLSFYDVILEEKHVGQDRVTFAKLRRNAPNNTAPPNPVVGVDEALPKSDEIVTAFVQIKNGAGNDIFATVRGLLVRDVNRLANILYVRGPEVIIINDFAPNVEYYVKIIRAIDVPAPGQILQIITCVHAPAEELGRLIQSALRPGSPQGVPGIASPAQTPATVTPDPRTNKLIIQAFPHQFPEIDRMLVELDVKTPTKGRFHRYRCKHTDAGELAVRLGDLLGAAATGGARKSSSKGKKSKDAPAPTSSAPAAAPPRDIAAGETRILADDRTNSLLVQCDEDAWAQIQELLVGKPGDPGLDSAVYRVLVEAQVWQISTPQDNATIGIELAGINNPARGRFTPSGLTSFGASTVGFDAVNNRVTRVPNVGGFTGILAKDSFDKLPVIVQAIASLEKSRLITTPFALTNDNSAATFSINNRIPYPTSKFAANGIGVTGADFVEVNTSLEVTPQVNSEDTLTLQIALTLASAGAQGTPGLPPSTNQRTYNGEVTVPNGKYVIFGGLEDESFNTVETKVPFLGDIPIFGHLFKQKQWSRTESKVYIFIRATIFTDERGPVRLAEDLRARAHVLAERAEWLPPIASDALVADRSVQEQSIEVFGTGSANPFGPGD